MSMEMEMYGKYGNVWNRQNEHNKLLDNNCMVCFFTNTNMFQCCKVPFKQKLPLVDTSQRQKISAKKTFSDSNAQKHTH